MNEQGGAFGSPMFAIGEPTDEQKAEMRAEANRLRNLQERSVDSEITRTKSDAVLKLAQAARALTLSSHTHFQKLVEMDISGGARNDVLVAIERIAKSIN